MTERCILVTGRWLPRSTEVRVALRDAWTHAHAPRAAIEAGIPITDPQFYSSSAKCPDEAIEHIFRPAAQCSESIPLLKERIVILRENGRILCEVRAHFSEFYGGRPTSS